MAYASPEIVKTFDSDLGLMLVTTDIGRNSTSDARLVYCYNPKGKRSVTNGNRTYGLMPSCHKVRHKAIYLLIRLHLD